MPIVNSYPACCLLRLLLDGADNLICSRPDWYGVPGILTVTSESDERTEDDDGALHLLSAAEHYAISCDEVFCTFY